MIAFNQSINLASSELIMVVLFLRRKSCFDRALKFNFDFDMYAFTNFLETALINAVMEGESETERQTKGGEEFLIQVLVPKKDCSLDAVVYRVARISPKLRLSVILS